MKMACGNLFACGTATRQIAAYVSTRNRNCCMFAWRSSDTGEEMRRQDTHHLPRLAVGRTWDEKDGAKPLPLLLSVLTQTSAPIRFQPRHLLLQPGMQPLTKPKRQ